MKRIIITVSVILIALAGIYAWWFFSNLTTFYEVVDDFISDDETIEEVSVFTVLDGEATLPAEESQEFYDSLLEASTETTIREIGPSPFIDYVINISTDHDRYTIFASDDDITLDEGDQTYHYTVHGDNDMMEFLEAYEFDFE